MARTRTRTPVPPNGFVASALRLPAVQRNEAVRPQGWQKSAWDFFDVIGELRYLSNWIGNTMSRAVLYAAKRSGNSLDPLDAGPAFEAMEALYGGPQGQSQMLQLLGVDLTVAGEGYITAREVDKEDRWDVLSTGKLTQNAQKVLTADFGDGKRTTLDPKKGDLVIRVWTPHPTNPTIADAPTRSNLKTLGQIVGYDDHITTQLTSRLAGNGILFLPNEIEFAGAPGEDPASSQADAFMAMLGEAMLTPIGDRASPAAVVPIVAMVPAEALAAIQHLTFWSELDDAVIGMRESAIKRFAIGMDVPPEVLLGNAEANHWNAWLSEESAIKSHLEPRLGVINSALTTTYLRPALKGMVPESELRDYFVIADTSAIRVRPNRAEEAMEMNERGIISDRATVRETGFKEEDMMTAPETVNWLLKRVAHGAVSPELAAAALGALGVDIGEVLGANGQEQPDHTRTDTVPQLERRDIPEMDTPLAAACEVLVYRALERAGNRLKNAHPASDTRGMRPDRIYMAFKGSPDELLAGAWDCAHDALASHDVNVDSVIDVLDFYTRGLLARQRPVSTHTLTHLLASAREPVLTG